MDCRGQAPRADVLAALLDRIALTGAAGFQPIAIANVLWSMAVLRRAVPTAVWCALLARTAVRHPWQHSTVMIAPLCRQGTPLEWHRTARLER